MKSFAVKANAIQWFDFGNELCEIGVLLYSTVHLGPKDDIISQISVSYCKSIGKYFCALHILSVNIFKISDQMSLV